MDSEEVPRKPPATTPRPPAQKPGHAQLTRIIMQGPTTVAQMLVPGAVDFPTDRFDAVDPMILCEAVANTMAQLDQRRRDVDGCLICAKELTFADFVEDAHEFHAFSRQQRQRRGAIKEARGDADAAAAPDEARLAEESDGDDDDLQHDEDGGEDSGADAPASEGGTTRRRIRSQLTVGQRRLLSRNWTETGRSNLLCHQHIVQLYSASITQVRLLASRKRQRYQQRVQEGLAQPLAESDEGLDEDDDDDLDDDGDGSDGGQ